MKERERERERHDAGVRAASSSSSSPSHAANVVLMTGITRDEFGGRLRQAAPAATLLPFLCRPQLNRTWLTW